MTEMQGLMPFRCLVNHSRINKMDQNVQGPPSFDVAERVGGISRNKRVK